MNFKTVIFLVFLVGFFPLATVHAVGREKPPKAKGQVVLKSLWTHGLKTGKSKKRFFPEVASPGYRDGRLYVGTHSQFFYALDVASKGRTLWQFESSGPIASEPLVTDRGVYFGNNEGMVYALDPQSGQKIWQHSVGGEVLSAPATNGSSLFVVTTDRIIYALDLADGSEEWGHRMSGYEKRVTMRGTSPVVVDGGSLYIGFADGQVVCMASGNGAIKWERSFVAHTALFQDVDGALLVDGGYVYTSGYHGFIYKLDKHSGRTIWEREVKSGVKMAVDANHLYVSTALGQVIGLDKETGIRIWDVNLYSGTLSSPALVRDYVVVGTENSQAYVFNKDSGEVVQGVKISRGYSGDAVVTDSQMFLLSQSGRVYALKID